MLRFPVILLILTAVASQTTAEFADLLCNDEFLDIPVSIVVSACISLELNSICLLMVDF